MSSQKSGNNNALTHGGTAQKLILPGENQADFEALLEDLRAEYQPETGQHHLFLEQLAMGHWFLWRRQRVYNAIEAAVYEAAEDNLETLNEDHFRRLALAERYKVSAERALRRAFTNAESIRKERKSERDYRERHARWQAQQELRERRAAMAQAKLELAQKKQNPPAGNATEKPRYQFPDKIVSRPIPEEIREQAIADAKAHWDRISKGLG